MLRQVVVIGVRELLAGGFELRPAGAALGIDVAGRVWVRAQLLAAVTLAATSSTRLKRVHGNA